MKACLSLRTRLLLCRPRALVFIGHAQARLSRHHGLAQRGGVAQLPAPRPWAERRGGRCSDLDQRVRTRAVNANRRVGLAAVPVAGSSMLSKDMAQALAPAVVQHAQIGIVGVQADNAVRGEAVVSQTIRSSGRPTEVGLERAVHGTPERTWRPRPVGLGGDDAVQHGLP